MRAISFEPSVATPVLPEQAFGIEIHLDPEGEPGSLFGAWRLPSDLVARRPLLWAVAIDSGSGRVFERALGGELRAEGAVSLDLLEHLGLPGEDRTYAVFLWVDAIASPLVFFRPTIPPSGPGFFAFSGSPPDTAPGDLELELVSGKLRGSVYVPGRGEGPLAGPVVLVAASARGLGSLCEEAPGSPDDEWRFLVPLEALVPPGEGRVHVIAFAQDMKSDVLTVRS